MSISETGSGIELSEREREILRLVATGASNKDIARQLTISPNTVKVHLRNIFGKIGVATRTEATLYAIRAGLTVVAADLRTRGQGDYAQNLADESSSAEATATANPISSVPGSTAHKADVARRSRSIMIWGGLVLIVLLAVGAALYELGRFTAQANAGKPTPKPPSWQQLAPLPTARSGLATVAYESQVYAIAGESATGVIGALERFDPARNTWATLAPKPVPVADVAGAVIGGRIYVPGGRLASGEVTSVVETYDIQQDRWTRAAALPHALSAYALVAHEGRLYLFGGWDGSGYLASVYEYDPGQDQWTQITSMPTARAFAGAAEAAGQIYVVGGRDGRQALDVSEVFVPDRQNSGQSPWDTAVPLPERRYGSGVTSVADTVYVIAGKSDTARSLQAIGYSPHSKSWLALQVPPSANWSHLSLIGLGSRLLVLGGNKDGVPSSDNLAYQVVYTVLLPVVQ